TRNAEGGCAVWPAARTSGCELQLGDTYSLETMAAMSSPASVGLSPTSTPASRSASIFAAAVPLPPETMAPAWPIFFPGGAVTPAMYDDTGLLIDDLMNAAASSSAEPPISPIIMTAKVSGSA